MTIAEEIDKKTQNPHRSGTITEALKYAYGLEHTPTSIADAIKHGTLKNPDERPEIGPLMYIGNASNTTLINADGTYAKGVQEGFTNVDDWEHYESGLVGIFDGVIVPATSYSENVLKFGSYIRLSFEANAETGDKFITVSALTGASHYAIYYCEDRDDSIHSNLGTIYYYGSLQNGNIINGDTYDVGVIKTYGTAWADAIEYITYFQMSLVSGGQTISGTSLSEHEIAFGETSLVKDVNAETGDYIITIANAPSHYAIYVKEIHTQS